MTSANNALEIDKHNAEPVWAVGLMTGTVLDGYIDVALLKTDGERIAEFGPYALEPYDSSVKEVLNETLQVALDWQFSGPEPSIFAKAEKLITEQQSKAVLNVLERAGFSANDINVVGFHGQSVLHRAPVNGEPGRTRQLGDGQLMSQMLSIPVAWDFRSADVVAGGQGAPLAPVYHQALLEQAAAKLSNRTAVLNLGGVANLTWWNGDTELIAFDTGPANAPVNDWVNQHTSDAMDVDGKLAAIGNVDEQRLIELLEHPYFNLNYPKSLDRFDFASSMAKGLNLQDGAALLTA